MPDIRLTMGSVIGPYHLHRNQPCQDRVMISESSGITVLAVADGAGSLAYSEIGAEQALVEVEKELSSIADATVDSAVYLVDSARAHILNLNDRELGCTLALALTDGERWSVAGIGDSFAVIHSDDGLSAYSSPPNEYANITQLLTSDSVDVWSDEGRGFRAAAVCSDGLERQTLVQCEPHEPFWLNLFQRTENGGEVQALLDFMNRSDILDDDTSAALAVRGDYSTLG